MFWKNFKKLLKNCVKFLRYKMLKKIEKNMKVSEIVRSHPEAAEILMEEGLFCAGCPMNGFETLEQGASGHGIDEEQIDKIVEKLNKRK